MMIRKATVKDLSRIAEIQIFNYRLYFYPIFKADKYYFAELQVSGDSPYASSTSFFAVDEHDRLIGATRLHLFSGWEWTNVTE